MKSIILYPQNSIISPFDFETSECNILLYDKNINIDIEFDRLVNFFLSETEFKNIIIPLCFGDVLSDYLGLRLATHIRTTFTINQNKNIFIYSFEGVGNLIDNDFFLILKTKGVSLIDYNLFEIQKSAEVDKNYLDKSDLPNEIAKINLTIPTNHFDNHSIANLWGAFRLIEIAEIDIKQIESLNPDDLKNIYFKWLQSKNHKTEIKNDEVLETNRIYYNDFQSLKDKIKNALTIDLSKIPKK
jgi:hypothetical protein